MREARYIRGNGSTKLRHKRCHSVSLIIELAACKALANRPAQALREIQALPLQNNHLLRYLSTSLSTQLDQEKSRRQEKQPSADDLGSPLVGMPQSVRRRAEEARDVSQRQSPLFTTGRSSTKSRRRGLTASTGPLPVREPARGLRVGVPAVAAVPDTPEVSRELEELAAALRPAEEETCDGLES